MSLPVIWVDDFVTIVAFWSIASVRRDTVEESGVNERKGWEELLRKHVRENRGEKLEAEVW